MPALIEPLNVDEDNHPVTYDFASFSYAFTKLSALIPDENKLRFSTAVDLAIHIEVKLEECLESETGCYILVTGVAEDMVEAIGEEMEELGIRKASRFTYEQTMESLIVRLMPGTLHEIVSWSFCFKVQDKVGNIPGYSEYTLCAVGATTFHFPGGGIKEGDGAFKPFDRRGDRDEWPSLMVEVGYSGSLPALRCDAQTWLETSGGRTRIVIIEIAKNPNQLRLECWRMIGDANGRVTGNAIPPTPGCSQYFDIDHAGTVSPAGHDLVIPYRTSFDTSPYGDPDITISAGELSALARIMYHLFRRSQPQAR